MATPEQWQVDDVPKNGFISACAGAVANDNEFIALRRSVGVRTVVDNYGLAGAQSQWAAAVSVNSPLIESRMRDIVYLDGLLPPEEKFRFGDWFLSPSMVRYVARAAILDRLCGGLDGKDVTEIGVGWGGLCAVACTLFAPKSYMLVDFPPVSSVAFRFAQYAGIAQAQCGDVPAGGDVMISDYALSELESKAQDAYLATFANYRFGSLTCPCFLGNCMVSTPRSWTERLHTVMPNAEILWGQMEPLYQMLANTCAYPSDECYTWRQP